MRLFEVTDSVRPGVRLVRQSGGVGVPLGINEDNGATILLPVGKSISRWMNHPDDADGTFKLHHASLRVGPSGRCLVKQLVEESIAERRALVFVDCCVDQELGRTRIDKARRRTAPEAIASFEFPGYTRELFKFKPGDALFICWPAAALEEFTGRPKRFIIAWDGQQLAEEACQRRLPPRPPRQARKKADSERVVKSQNSSMVELQPVLSA
jgi:hypothetical protein